MKPPVQPLAFGTIEFAAPPLRSSHQLRGWSRKPHFGLAAEPTKVDRPVQRGVVVHATPAVRSYQRLVDCAALESIPSSVVVADNLEDDRLNVWSRTPILGTAFKGNRLANFATNEAIWTASHRAVTEVAAEVALAIDMLWQDEKICETRELGRERFFERDFDGAVGNRASLREVEKFERTAGLNGT